MAKTTPLRSSPARRSGGAASRALPTLVTAIRRFCDGWNQRRQPIARVKDADDILVKATPGPVWHRRQLQPTGRRRGRGEPDQPTLAYPAGAAGAPSGPDRHALAGHPVRVAVDGVDAAGKTSLADELVGPLAARGRTVLPRVR
jgi:hypothetical protein